MCPANSPVGEFRSSTLVELVRARAERAPDSPLFSFLPTGEGAAIELTLGELDHRARAIAARIASEARPGDRALLLYAGGLDFITSFFGCLYAGVVAVPAYPPEPGRLERTLPRLAAIAADAQAGLVLTTNDIMALSGQFSDRLPDVAWLASDRVGSAEAQCWRPPRLDGESVALLQYTSGSTGTPKGVQLSHRNLLYNQELIRLGFEHDERTVVVGWLPVFHDMGLIGTVLQPVYLGVHCILMPPFAFLQRPARWLKAISRYRATTSGGPNFGYELCARKVTPEERGALDLSTWTLAFNGAEPIDPRTFDRFVDSFADCGFRREAFYPCYGMAEATLMISGGAKARAPVVSEFDEAELSAGKAVARSGPGSRRLVGCGATLLDQEIAIVAPDTRVGCPEGVVGEIWVRGPCVARGYWNRDRGSDDAFGAVRADTGEESYLRTGDLGFLQDGQLYVTGRLKDVIIIRGLNYYPQDIERDVAECHPALRPGSGAAFSLTAEVGEELAVVQELRSSIAGVDFDEVLTRIRRVVTARHQIPVARVVLIEAGTIPKTSSGKIQRSACRAALLANELVEQVRWTRNPDDSWKRAASAAT